jgi:hypothetical protein
MKEPRNFRDVKDRSLVLREWRKRKGCDVKKKILVEIEMVAKGGKELRPLFHSATPPVRLAEMVLQ